MKTKDHKTERNETMMIEVDCIKELDYRFSHLRHMPKVGKLR